jgi:zinc transport system ATP-binding protein
MQNIDHSKNIIEIKNINFSYDGKTNILEDINLEIHKGDYVGIIGPNGSGKSTLLKLILGLLKKQKGEIKIFGEDITKFKNKRRIAYIPQKAIFFDNYFPATVYDVIEMSINKKYFREKNLSTKERIQEVLEKVAVFDLKDRNIAELSGGQQQRVFIARALVNDPNIIFLDEPTTGIDQKNKNDFFELLKKLNQKEEKTIVLISHDIEKITEEVMHIICINKNLVCHTTPEDFIKQSKTKNLLGENIKIITHHHEH